ncbi:MAG: hypothetical protein U0795_07030 [Pirellulales bacterium]
MDIGSSRSPHRRCVALFSGMLDSILAVALVQQQGVEVHGLSYRTPFNSGQEAWLHEAATRLGITLEMIPLGADYLQRIRYPQFGFGRGANPCLDCRLVWLRDAAQRVQRGEADFVITGEVLGQKAFGQKRRDLLRLSLHSGLGERLVRPLSARRLPETEVEQLGWLDRQQLGEHSGSSRSELLREGARSGWTDAPSCGNCCRLIEPGYAAKVEDLWAHGGRPSTWDFRLLNGGRHYRLSGTAKLVVAHNAAESEWLMAMSDDGLASPSVLLEPASFTGPTGLLIGPPLPRHLQLAWSLIRRAARGTDERPEGWSKATGSERQREVLPEYAPEAELLTTISQGAK